MRLAVKGVSLRFACPWQGGWPSQGATLLGEEEVLAVRNKTGFSWLCYRVYALLVVLPARSPEGVPYAVICACERCVDACITLQMRALPEGVMRGIFPSCLGLINVPLQVHCCLGTAPWTL